MKTRFALLALLVSLCLALPLQAIAQLFTRVTTGLVVTTPSGSRSCNFLDYDRDDFQDILITNGKQGGEDDMLYHNERDGSFTLASDTVCHDGDPSDGATCGDYDNDGRVDIYVSNWYGVDNLLYHNGGAGFARIDTGIVPLDGGYSETASWGDMDGDGLLDLYVANSDGNFRNFLYRNLGGGAFEKVATLVPATEQYRSRCVNWIDMDLDGDQDLFVANEAGQRNNLYRNDGYPTFTKVTTGPAVTNLRTSHSSSWADYDNDGDFDLMVANYNQASELFQNDGSGTLTQVAMPFGSDVGCSFSSSFADYDNDADLDLFVTNGYCTSYTRNFLYDNNGDGTFTRNMAEPMAIDSGSSYGCAWGDYDNDGFQDLVVANWRGETQPNSLYHNSGNGNHWVELRLEGSVSNRSAIGTVVRCNAVVNGSPLWQLREVSGQTGYCSQNSLVVHVGLADASFIDSLQVEWPSGIVQTFTNIAADRLYSLQENGLLGIVGVTSPLANGLEMKAFPQPSDGNLTVEVHAAADMPATLVLIDIMGNVLHALPMHLPDGKSLWPLSIDLPAGTYLLQLRGTDATLLQRRILIVR